MKAGLGFGSPNFKRGINWLLSRFQWSDAFLNDFILSSVSSWKLARQWCCNPTQYFQYIIWTSSRFIELLFHLFCLRQCAIKVSFCLMSLNRFWASLRSLISDGSSYSSTIWRLYRSPLKWEQLSSERKTVPSNWLAETSKSLIKYWSSSFNWDKLCKFEEYLMQSFCLA